MSEAGSIKRQVGRPVGGVGMRPSTVSQSHCGFGVKGDWEDKKYIPTLIRLDYLNMELPPEQRSELRRQALASCVGFEARESAVLPNVSVSMVAARSG